MAKMLPAWVDPGHTKSSAEVSIFELLRDSPGTETWTVIHSLGLLKTDTRPYGEIDFVIMIPYTAVICVEVKGGGIACDENGIWTSTDRNGRIHRLSRGPFDQARDSMFSLRRSLVHRIPECAKACAIGFAVATPDITLDIGCITWERDTFIDQRDLPPRSRTIVPSFLRIAESIRNRHRTAAANFDGIAFTAVP
jgi:hypothetical protein